MNKVQVNIKSLVLEPSTNTHIISGDIKEALDMGNGIIRLKMGSKGVLQHGNKNEEGNHDTLVTQGTVQDGKILFKYVQQEMNPVTGKIQNAYD